MDKSFKQQPTIIDYATGKRVPDIGAEANRQAVERFLVDVKGYRREDIAVDCEVVLDIVGRPYPVRLDLVVMVDRNPVIVFKCAAGSLDSREREVVTAARVAFSRPVPWAVASDGKTALVYDAIRKTLTGRGMDQIPSPEAVRKLAEILPADPLPADRLEKEKIIFRSYDIMNVNVHRGSGGES